MSETHLFVLCSTGKLKIFDLERFELTKEIEVNADKMKLVSPDHLALFDTDSCMAYLFEQDCYFNLTEKFEFSNSLAVGLKLASDKTKSLAFYNQTQMKYLSFD